MDCPRPTDFDGLLLVGHGTREPQGLAEFYRLVELTRSADPALNVEGCFLELAEPTIAAGLRSLACRGARRVQAVPLLLFAAGHAKRDIPQALAAAARELPGMHVEQAPHLGTHSLVLELSQRRFRAAIGYHQPVSAANTLLVLVGRGSNDAEATAEMHRFAEMRHDPAESGGVETAFMAMAEPRLETVLEQAARSDYPRIVVQPHLLFAGLLLADLRAAVARWAARTPGKEWLLTEHLGPDSGLATAIRQLAVGNGLVMK